MDWINSDYVRAMEIGPSAPVQAKTSHTTIGTDHIYGVGYKTRIDPVFRMKDNRS